MSESLLNALREIRSRVNLSEHCPPSVSDFKDVLAICDQALAASVEADPPRGLPSPSPEGFTAKDWQTIAGANADAAAEWKAKVERMASEAHRALTEGRRSEDWQALSLIAGLCPTTAPAVKPPGQSGVPTPPHPEVISDAMVQAACAAWYAVDETDRAYDLNVERDMRAAIAAALRVATEAAP